MSEPAAEPIEDQESEPVVNDDKPTTAEGVARAGGWKPLEDWEGEAKDWRSAEVFNERGDWIQRHKAQEKRLDEMENRFNTRADNMNKLHKHQMEVQKAELVRKRDEAIDNADRKTANEHQATIDDINAQPVDTAPASNDQALFDQWNKENLWINQATPKAAYAVQMCSVYQKQGMNAQEVITAIENDLKREFPAINPERDKHPVPEGGTPPGKRRAGRKLTMRDLTSDELKYYRAMPTAWKSEADFLQTVQDTRGES